MSFAGFLLRVDRSPMSQSRYNSLDTYVIRYRFITPAYRYVRRPIRLKIMYAFENYYRYVIKTRAGLFLHIPLICANLANNSVIHYIVKLMYN